MSENKPPQPDKYPSHVAKKDMTGELEKSIEEHTKEIADLKEVIEKAYNRFDDTGNFKNFKEDIYSLLPNQKT